MIAVTFKPATLAPTLTGALKLIRETGISPEILLEQCIMSYDYDFFAFSRCVTDAILGLLQDYEGSIPEFSNVGVLNTLIYPTISEIYAGLSPHVKNTYVVNIKWTTPEDICVYFE